MKTLIIVALLVVASSCATKQKLLDATAVSMTHQSLEPGQNLVEIGEVESEFCADQWSDKGAIGLMDEAINSAQKKSGADFITNATFWRMGNCVSITGTGKKINAVAQAAALPVKKNKKK
jgi:hypothetical protein